MAFIYHTFTNQGGSDGCFEVVNYMTENFPGLFDTYAVSSTNVQCKIGNKVALTLINPTNSGAGYIAQAESMTYSFAVSNQAVYRGVIADTDTQTAVFLSGGGEYPIITICKNEDGDTCGVAFAQTGNTSLLMASAGTMNAVLQSDIHVYNFTRGTHQKNPCGFARTEQNAVCAYPLVDKDGRKIQNVWVGGSSALRGLTNPIEISVDNDIYCSIKYGWLLIK